MSARDGLEFEHVYVPGDGRTNLTLLLLHGTGGTEHDLLDVAGAIAAGANVLSPRGKVLERGMPRFFRRLAEGVFDVADVIARAHELADFVATASTVYRFDARGVVAVGFSNGANIAGATMLLRPETLRGAALWRGMVPLVPERAPALAGRDILLTNGLADPMVSVAERERLAALFRGYGATVETAGIRAGHQLTAEDLAITKEWLRRCIAAEGVAAK